MDIKTEKEKAMKKVLVVDDNDIHLLIVDGILKGKYETTTAKSGKEALAIISKGYIPDFILLDVLMPEIDGWETFNKIKGVSLLRDVPIAFFTSLDGEKEKRYAAQIGAVDLITKPCEGEELLKRIKNILEKN